MLRLSPRSKMKRVRCIFLTLIFCALIETVLPASFAQAEEDVIHVVPALRTEQLAPISAIVKKEIRKGRIPGAVVLIGNRNKVLYRKAFGNKAIKPKKSPMAENTIFDLASLTKVIATTTAVMQLVENGKLQLEKPVAKYWPEFKANGKDQITVLELLTHYSGLRPDLDLKPELRGYDAALEMIIEEKPLSPPGAGFVYSDINFEILGELVRRVSGMPLDAYCSEHIFGPLGMKDTSFSPALSQRKRIAPTQYRSGNSGELLQGEVHDPACRRMGGVAGHAGLFSTADDLSIFARMLLSGGSFAGVKILDPHMVEQMTVPRSPPGKTPLRGLGWNISSPFASNRDELFSAGSYGHKGFTGTMMWIDPVTEIYIIILTNRVHPRGKGDADPLRKDIISLVSKAQGRLAEGSVLARRQSLMNCLLNKENSNKVESGIDVLEKEGFKPLEGLRIGLITNQSGIDFAGRRTADLLYEAQDIKLVALFSPEHGLSGNLDKDVSSTRDYVTGVPVYSLYGKTLRPSEKMLDGLDALVFDVQDIGVRFYTYITTMAYAMEAAARKGIAFYVLDRPNPLNALYVQGPVMDERMKSFTGYFPLPIRHGMTVGELAEMFNSENQIGAKVHVIKMNGYRRSYWYDETGLPWVNPSPNVRNLKETILYPGVALAEGSNVSVGRGTDTPFEVVGAPWIHAKKLAFYLNRRNIKGVSFAPVDFIPKNDKLENKKCHGIRIVLKDRSSFDPSVLGIEIISALVKLYPKDFQLDQTVDLIGSRQVLRAIKNNQDPLSIRLKWQNDLNQFKKLRSKYLLYS